MLLVITACSYNSIIGIKYISYWFMSCLPLAFPSVWINTISQVSSDVLLCNLRGWMGWLLPYVLFGFLKDLSDTVPCSPCTVHHLDFSAWFLSHPVFNTPPWFHCGDVTETCIWWQCFKMFLGVSGLLSHP